MDYTTTVQLIKLPVDRWSEYKALRLRALTEDPQAFATSSVEIEAEPDHIWMSTLQWAIFEQDYWLWFVEEENALIGMVGAFYDVENQAAVLTNAYVVKEHRGKGVSKLLMQRILEDIEDSGITKTILEVSSEQKVAIALYQKFGFEKSGETSRMLGDGKSHQVYLFEKR
jgi:ribosomal protein S18 acetylase RimI-like enzyme